VLCYPFLHAPHQIPFDGEQSAHAPQQGQRIGMLLMAGVRIVHSIETIRGDHVIPPRPASRRSNSTLALSASCLVV
jgi:hypothetical protein